MFLKIFILAFVLIAVASMALAFAMLRNKPEENCQHGEAGDDSCAACGVKSMGSCALHGEA